MSDILAVIDRRQGHAYEPLVKPATIQQQIVSAVDERLSSLIEKIGKGLEEKKIEEPPKRPLVLTRPTISSGKQEAQKIIDGGVFKKPLIPTGKEPAVSAFQTSSSSAFSDRNSPSFWISHEGEARRLAEMSKEGPAPPGTRAPFIPITNPPLLFGSSGMFASPQPIRDESMRRLGK